jgi:hypothetical protein
VHRGTDWERSVSRGVLHEAVPRPGTRSRQRSQESGSTVWSHATRPTGRSPRILNPEARLRCWVTVKALGPVSQGTSPLVVWPHSLSH